MQDTTYRDRCHRYRPLLPALVCLLSWLIAMEPDQKPWFRGLVAEEESVSLREQ